MKLRITPDGTVRGLWDDAVDWAWPGQRHPASGSPPADQNAREGVQPG